MSTTYPYGDTDMRYDYDLHKYVLRPDYVLRELGIDLNTILNTSGDANPSSLADRVLKQVSNTVYNYIYQNKWDKDRLEYELALVPSLREKIKEMLTSQTLYALTNGFIQNYSGINITKATAMNINALRGRAMVSFDVETICGEPVSELGRCLNYIGVLPTVPSDEYRVGY